MALAKFVLAKALKHSGSIYRRPKRQSNAKGSTLLVAGTYMLDGPVVVLIITQSHTLLTRNKKLKSYLYKYFKVLVMIC